LTPTGLGLVLTLALAGALRGSPAHGETPVLIACEGTLVTDASGARDFTGYYRMTGSQFQEWDDAQRAWGDNICARKGYSCSTAPGAYHAEGTFVSASKQHVKHAVSIDRTTGRVEEFWNVRYGESRYFDGDCKPSADPSLLTAPTKF
jgi:hypothetical protein